jgi:hypothetical protein
MDGTVATELPLVIPRPVSGLVSKRVLVMDYLHGVPLSRAREEMLKKGIDPESSEAKLFGRKLLKALTFCFGRNILETGFFHAGKHLPQLDYLVFPLKNDAHSYNSFCSFFQTHTRGIFLFLRMEILV